MAVSSTCAENAEVMRRIGVLHRTPESDLEAKVELAAFEQELTNLGWREGQNIRIVYRFGAGDATRIAAFAKELVASKPDLVVARSTPVLKALAARRKRSQSYSLPFPTPSARAWPRPRAAGWKYHRIYQCGVAMAGKWVELLEVLSLASSA